jgi:hypothetical protein
MRSLSLCAVVLCSLSLSATALAEGPRDKSNSQFRLRQGDLASGAGEQARSRARAGDCLGALDHFDRAIAVHPDPALVRDRGLCHDKLNHTYPAIRDYRAYLAERPDAPDADQVRTRLGALEGSVGISKEDNKGDPANVADTPAQRTALENLIEEERLSDSAATSPLRKSSGFVLGIYGGMRTFFGNGGNSTSSSSGALQPKINGFFDTGKTDQLGYQVGISARYSAGTYFEVLGEGGLVSYGKVGTQGAVSGPGFLLAGQVRLPIGKYASDELIIGLGPGYERYSNKFSGTQSVILGVGRLGYRHTFGANFGMELVGYGGLAHFTFVDVPVNANIDDANAGILGLQLDVLLGF